MVILAAKLVMTIVASMMWQVWAGQAATTEGPGSVSWLFTLANAPNALVLLWAFLSDAVPLWGTRREGYLLLMALVAAVVWLALAVGAEYRWAWLAAAVPLGLAASFSHATIAGALTEIGQRRAATGRLASASFGLAQLAGLTWTPLTFMSTFTSIALGSGIAAALALAVVLLIVTLTDEGAPARPPAASEVRIRISRFVRSRPFWASFAVLFWAGLATVPTFLIDRHRSVVHPDHLGPGWTAPAGALAATAA